LPGWRKEKWFFQLLPGRFPVFVSAPYREQKHMSPELVDKALEKVGNPNVLVNVVSRRVRQLNSGNRPMLVVPATMGAADIALTEIVEGKLAWELPDTDADSGKKGRRRKRS